MCKRQKERSSRASRRHTRSTIRAPVASAAAARTGLAWCSPAAPIEPVRPLVLPRALALACASWRDAARRTRTHPDRRSANIEDARKLRDPSIPRAACSSTHLGASARLEHQYHRHSTQDPRLRTGEPHTPQSKS
eukprot:scaffold30415_cov124-Isochrysis_galbana.AAC.9